MGLKKLYGIHNPKIAICSLNPHAGEGGLLGSEEKDFISPIILKIQKAFPSAKLSGPYPSDTLFATELLKKTKSKRFDAIIAMYHDQGLIPVKLVDFKNTVNITLGLPIIRTSVDHGVGFDIVGKNIADPSSFIQAIQLASRFIST